MLNAKNHEREAEIIANAGTKNSIIITTSISGRGVDIKLGGKENKNNEKINTFGKENMNKIEKQIMLQVVDQNWKEHLLQLDQLRQGIGLRAYAQRDPLNEYKSEAFNLFHNMLNNIRNQVTAILLNIELVTDIPQRKEQNTTLVKESFNENEDSIPKKNQPIKSTKIGRNEMCPCGSGKKYKHCYGTESCKLIS